MRMLPLDIGAIHFVGIGGIGMSGIAEVLHNQGYSVQGSDIIEGANIKRLSELGITIAIGHKEENLLDAIVVVISSAVKDDNPEVVAARASHIPVVRRAEMLGELMRLKWGVAVGGTHGKTTTTSLLAALFDAGGLDPTVINGGIINSLGSNAKLGESDWMLVEADESDGTFINLPATIVVVTNIDPEHLDHYGSFDAVRNAFQSFVENLPFYGFAVLCIDHSEVQAMIPKVSDRRILTYGFSPQADVRAINLESSNSGMHFDAILSHRRDGSRETIKNLFLPMHGQHNVQNALAAIAIGGEIGMESEVIRQALCDFRGVKRRFTKIGEMAGITVIDDYGHHPVEISAVLKAARDAVDGKVIAVVQPHRYSRLYDLFEEFCTCFNDADSVLVADVYAAGEVEIEGINKEALVDGLMAHGHRAVKPLASPAELANDVCELAQAGDMVVCLGAGNITQWAAILPMQIGKIKGMEGNRESNL